MNPILSFLGGNALWLMIIAVVGIGCYFKYRERELQVHQQMREREMEHQRRMKELELEIEKARNDRSGQPVG